MLLNPTEHIQQQLFWYGHYEKDVRDLLKRIVKPNDVFIDIGANIGYFSLLVGHRFPSARIISFEPVVDLFRKMNDNIALNKIENIVTINAAAGEINEEKELFISAPDNLGMSSFHQPENYSGFKEKVKVVTIDGWFKGSGLSKVDILKLDIEGSELAALKGMKEVLKNFKPLLLIEINPETLSMFNLKPSDIYDFLEEFGFKRFLILENAKLKELTQIKTGQTINVLFVHQEKIESISPFITL